MPRAAGKSNSVIMSAKKLYVIANSHMDPIWLWRLREGRSTWLNTCRSVVRMLKKHPFLKFCRSSSCCYEWIEKCDPQLFGEIRELVEAGRWEPVGGWVEQSDTIITPGEALFRQAEYGKRYFRSKFGKDIRIGYSVDSFGQNAGLPKILKATGFDRYVFMRPMAAEKNMPYLFRWRGDDGSQVVTLRIRQAYCTTPLKEKQELFDKIDQLFAEGDEHQTFFFGVGDHGGGIYEKQLEWLLEAAETRNIEFSTLSHYFDVIEKTELPVFTGELTHHSPGCYSAVSGIKQQMAAVERTLFKAEKILLEQPDSDAEDDARRLDEAWNQVLFNYFHDIYPGTAVKKAFAGEVRDLTGYAQWIASSILEKRLARFAARADSSFLTEGGVLLWNPLPVPVRAVFGFDTFADPNCNGRDFNALRDSDGHTVPLQFIRAATPYGPAGVSWGRATAVADLPPSGLRLFAYTHDDTHRAATGFERQKAAFRRISFPVIADVGDTWGHALTRLGETAGKAELLGFEEIDNGETVSCLRGHYRWKDSSFRLDLFAFAGIPELFARWHAEWHEKDDTVKLGWQTGIENGSLFSGQAAATLTRTPDECEQPFIGFVAAQDGDGKSSGILAEALHSYDSFGSGELRLTLLRPVCYAEHVPTPPHGDEGYADLGEVEQEFWLTDGRPASELPAVTRERLWGAEHLEITAAADGTHFQRPLWRVEPPEAITLCQNSRQFRLWNSADTPKPFRIWRDNCEVASGQLASGQIRTIPLP